MKKFIGSLLITLFFFSAIPALAQQMDMQEMMKVWMEYMTPGDMHKMMAKNVGTWNTKTTFWNHPGAEPSTTEGTAEMESILGGRYIKTVHKSMVMGMPMEGWSIDAYDNGKKEFISIWIDNMGTGVSISRGTYDESSATHHHTGIMYDAMSGKDTKFRSVVKQIDDNKIVFDMYGQYNGQYNGQEFKMMEMVYTR